jgi:hypothetical protein
VLSGEDLGPVEEDEEDAPTATASAE